MRKKDNPSQIVTSDGEPVVSGPPEEQAPHKWHQRPISLWIAMLTVYAISCAHLEYRAMQRMNLIESNIDQIFARSIQHEWELDGVTVRVISFPGSDEGLTAEQTIKQHNLTVQEILNTPNSKPNDR